MSKTLDEQLKERYARWEHLCKYGGQDPNWPDGCNMNLVRNHIIFTKEKMKEAGEFTETYYRELPPEVDPEYMARADEIREHAKKSIEIYKKHPDYIYLCEHKNYLNARQKDQTCIENVIGYVRGLEMFIERDLLVDMRRHEDPERYIESFTSCRKAVEKILGEKPRLVFYKDKKQLEGQLSITDFLTV